MAENSILGAKVRVERCGSLFAVDEPLPCEAAAGHEHEVTDGRVANDVPGCALVGIEAKFGGFVASFQVSRSRIATPGIQIDVGNDAVGVED